MNCRNCGSQVDSINAVCPTCGFLPLNGKTFCQECGYETDKDQEICINCNKPLKYATIVKRPTPTNNYQSNSYTNNYRSTNYSNNYRETNRRNEIDEPNVAANVGACCSIPFTGGLPIVGLVLYLIWKDEKPNAAKSACMWSLIPFIFIIVFYLIFFVFGLFASYY